LSWVEVVLSFVWVEFFLFVFDRRRRRRRRRFFLFLAHEIPHLHPLHQLADLLLLLAERVQDDVRASGSGGAALSIF